MFTITTKNNNRIYKGDHYKIKRFEAIFNAFNEDYIMTYPDGTIKECRFKILDKNRYESTN